MLSQPDSVDMGETEVVALEKLTSPTMRDNSCTDEAESGVSQDGGGGGDPESVVMAEPDIDTECDTRKAQHEDSCGSEDEGRLHIVTPSKEMSIAVALAKKYQEVEPGSEPEDDFVDDEEEQEDFFEEDERTIRQHLYNQQRQQAYARGAFGVGNLTVTKFPLNGHGQGQPGSFPRAHHHHHSSSSQFGNMLKRDREGMPTGGNGSGRAGPADLLMCPPQSSPLGPFPNNINNNTSSINHNLGMMKGVVPSATSMAALLSTNNNNGHSYSHPSLKSDQGHEKFISQRRSHHHAHGYHHHQPAPFQEAGSIKAERKSPNYSDVKPESLATGSLNHLSRSIGNALLNLASLGSLAALQQHGASNNSSSISPPCNNAGGSNPNNSSNLAPSASMTPLNLTNGNCAGLSSISSSASLASITNALASNSYLAQYIGQQQQQHQLPTGGSNNGPSSNLSNGNNLPQLILASGSIVQGIQGAQLLIPTSQGLMTQTVLTIPITQPASPSSILGSSASSLSPPSSGSKKTSGQSHGHGHATQQQHHPGSSPSTPMVPSSGSPSDFSGPPAPHMNLSSQLVSQQLGAAHIPIISDKMDRLGNTGLPLNPMSGLNLHGSMNGLRMSNGRRESNSSSGMSGLMNPSHAHNNNNSLSSHHHHSQSICPPSNLSPCSSHSRDSCDFLDRCSDNDDDQTMDGINLDEIKEFAKAFKLRRLSLGLTQTQVGQALSVTEGPAYSQSAICSALAWQLAQSHDQSNSNRTSIPPPSMFEKLDITPKSAQKIKPVLERWMKEAEDRYRNGHQNLNEFVGMEPSKKRKRRTSFTPQALEILNTHFERNTHPSGAEITTLAHQLGYEREVIRIWFCNKRQALKNTVRMMSKGGGSPI